jgi:hypothetical protein
MKAIKKANKLRKECHLCEMSIKDKEKKEKCQNCFE